jgi:hypothetical protein
MAGTEKISQAEFRAKLNSGEFEIGRKGKIVASSGSFPAPKASVPTSAVRPTKKPKRGKFGNIKTPDPEGGKAYDSMLEAKHGAEYVQMAKLGKIRKVTRQVKFLVERYEFSKKEIHYIADFLIDHLDGSQEAVDSKGVQTKEFKRKAKWFQARYPQIKLTIRTAAKPGKKKVARKKSPRTTTK